MGQTQARPDYQYAACRVNGGLGTLVYSTDGIVNLTKIGIGEYEITTDGIDANECVVMLQRIAGDFSVVSLQCEFLSSTVIRVRTGA